jgi:cell division protein ZapA (FtsZ GTPase activity inhibitor)
MGRQANPPSGDVLRLAVLAALNIADELFRRRRRNRPAAARWPNGPSAERLMDAALAT